LERLGKFDHHLPLLVIGPLAIRLKLFQDMWRAEKIQRDSCASQKIGSSCFE
jgi:hypothetical protein